MSLVKLSAKVGDKTLSIETGRMAKQASSVVVQLGDTVVLTTAVSSDPRPGIDFFPLTCDYVEKVYAAGRIPGGFFKREGRPSEREVLTSRLIDRPIRPMFADGYKNEVQVIATVLSADTQNLSDVLAMTGASAALSISSIPFEGPLAGLRVGRIDGRFVAFPTREQMEASDMDLIMAVSRESIVMVEGGCQQVSEEDLLAALEFGHAAAQPLIDLQIELREKAGVPLQQFEKPPFDEALADEMEAKYRARLTEALTVPDKMARRDAVRALKQEMFEALASEREEDEAALTPVLRAAFDRLEKRIIREMVLDERRRIDGRATDEVRPITVEVGVLPRTHGSALFTRGETQALVVATLGTADDAQRIDALEGDSMKDFTLHYNFPPFSVGETRMLRSPGRREIGHGALAERALRPVAPLDDSFPYTIRLVSEILESNGSSSMASVCGGSLAAFDAGIPMKAAVAGIAMGLIKEGDRVAILTDILGDEDHLGDMDFKVAGTRDGITAFQMDTKIKGISMDIMRRALAQAREGRYHILDKMAEVLPAPRSDLSPHAPRITSIWINTDRIRDVIGPGGKTIRGIIEKTGVKIDVEDSGQVLIASPDADAANRAERMVRELTQEAEVGKLYLGQVKRVTDFGAFVEIFPGTEGLVHISHLTKGRVRRVTDVVNEGDEVLVKVIDIDRSGKIRLSRKEALDDSMDEGFGED